MFNSEAVIIIKKKIIFRHKRKKNVSSVKILVDLTTPTK
jgi:hypothetical protein